MSNRFKAPRLPRGVTAKQLLARIPNTTVRNWRRGNLRALANFMSALPGEKHKQSTFCGLGGTESNGFCGTRSCALGWFMMGGLSPHMGWTFFKENYAYAVRESQAVTGNHALDPGADALNVIPVVNNVALVQSGGQYYRYLGTVFFGKGAWEQVFSEAYLSTPQVVEGLSGLSSVSAHPDELGVEKWDSEHPCEAPHVANVLVKRAPRELAVHYVCSDVIKFASLEEFRRSPQYLAEIKRWKKES